MQSLCSKTDAQHGDDGPSSAGINLLHKYLLSWAWLILAPPSQPLVSGTDGGCSLGILPSADAILAEPRPTAGYDYVFCVFGSEDMPFPVVFNDDYVFRVVGSEDLFFLVVFDDSIG